VAGRVVVVGSSNIDLIMKMARLPRRGETVTDATFVRAFGGKGANQAVGAARAGGDVIFVGCVGDDGYADEVVIMVGEDGENYLAVAPGANDRLSPAHVDRARGALEEAAVVMAQCEIPAETLAHVIDLGARLGKPVMLNLAPARPVAEASLRRLAWLAVNETEAEFLTGLSVRTDAEAAAAADALRARGPRTVVLTLGERGSFVSSEEHRGLVPAFPVEAVDTTAAGDVHCGALAVALVEGRPLREAVRFANAAAALSVTRLGAQPSAPRRPEIDALLAPRA
jgi:ribokinase